MRRTVPVTAGVCLLIAALAAMPAQGAVVSGTEYFESVEYGWEADVDYAVYAPGDYPGTHPYEEDHYIYVYQIFNYAVSQKTLSAFSVGLDDGAAATDPGDDDTYGVTGGEAPLLSRLIGDPPGSVAWTIDIDPDDYSTALVYSSPNSWQWKTASLVDGGQSVERKLPSPIPEPATMGLLGLGGLALMLRRRRRT